MTSSKKPSSPSVLAFERKLDPSDGLMFSGDWGARKSSDKWKAIPIREMRGRGTASQRQGSQDFDPIKVQQSQEKPNLVWTDLASLPHDSDTLKLVFSLRVLGGLGEPCACNDAGFKASLSNVVSTYVEKIGLSELALRYATGIANGRFLWRNRPSAEQVEVLVEQLCEGRTSQEWCFNALDLPLREPARSAEAVQDLAKVIEQGLLGGDSVLLRISAFARIGAGQPVYPSQELVLDRKPGDKSKWLYKIEDSNGCIAAMHSQKIGNALRTIDTWHPSAAEVGPISVEPYGSVTNHGEAYRKPDTRLDFYTLFDAWVINGKEPSPEQQHFVIANLIRGGVFSDGAAKKGKKGVGKEAD